MDTIAAISTGTAASGIGVIRVSGANCFAICAKVFRAANGRPFADQQPGHMVFGDMLDAQGRTIDRGLAVRFAGPHCYTGEDSAEFHCHGSPVVLRELLTALFAAGARQAERGEFTKRAFLNGKLDLTQSEAVIDLIEAETAAAARNSIEQLGGTLRRDFEEITETLLDISSRFYAVVDYPDEDIEDIHPHQIADALDHCEKTLARLLATCERGKVLKNGVRTAIVGRPNAGKSSLLNALAGYERAIVTDIPGTTRDTVEESVLCGGVLLRLIDTAGIRDTEDKVEALGVERSRQAMESADLVLAVVDGSGGVSEEDMPFLLSVAKTKRWILIWSKKDLTAADAFLDFPMPLSMDYHCPAAVVQLSAVTGDGIDALESAVAGLFPEGETPAGSILANERQQEAALRTKNAISRAKEAMALALTPDAVLTDVEQALDALGELTGRSAKETIVSRIFERFCVGK